MKLLVRRHISYKCLGMPLETFPASGFVILFANLLRQQPPGSMTTTEEMKKFIAASDTRLLNYQNCLFKIKMTFCQGLVQYENSLCLHAEIEEVVRAVLSIIQNKRHLVTIETQHFMVNISLIPWYAQQKLQFYKHENECQVYNHMIKLQFALRPSVSLQKSSQNSQQQIGCQKSISSTATKTPQREQVTQKDVLCDVSGRKSSKVFVKSKNCEASHRVTVRRKRKISVRGCPVDVSDKHRSNTRRKNKMPAIGRCLLQGSCNSVTDHSVSCQENDAVSHLSKTAASGNMRNLLHQSLLTDGSVTNFNNSSVYSRKIRQSQKTSFVTNLSSVEKNVPCKTSVETNCRQSVPTEECLKTANQKKKAEQQFSQSLLLGGGTVQDQSHLRDRHVVECGDLQEENHLQQLAAAYTATSAQDRKRNSSMLDWFLTPFKLALKNRKQ